MTSPGANTNDTACRIELRLLGQPSDISISTSIHPSQLGPVEMVKSDLVLMVHSVNSEE